MQDQELSPIEQEWARQEEQHKAHVKEVEEQRKPFIEKQKSDDNDIVGLLKSISKNSIWFYIICIIVIIAAGSETPKEQSYILLAAGVLNALLIGIMHFKKTIVPGVILLILIALDTLYTSITHESGFPLMFLLIRLGIIFGLVHIINLVIKYNKAILLKTR